LIIRNGGLRASPPEEHSYCTYEPGISGAANGWQTTNSKPPGPIIVIEESKIGNSSKIIYIILLSSR
jgi:hypothetical protein